MNTSVALRSAENVRLRGLRLARCLYYKAPVLELISGPRGYRKCAILAMTLGESFVENPKVGRNENRPDTV